MTDALILYASTHGHTAKLAARIAEVMRDDGASVDLHDVACAPDRVATGYRAFVLGGSIHGGHHQHELIAWAKRHAGRRRAGTVSMSAPGRSAFRIGFGTPGLVTAIAAAGDWNRDGRPDIAVADGSGFRGAGAIWIVYGARRRGTVNIARLGRAGALIRGNPVTHYLLQGGGLAGGGDVDGDAPTW